MGQYINFPQGIETHYTEMQDLVLPEYAIADKFLEFCKESAYTHGHKIRSLLILFRYFALPHRLDKKHEEVDSTQAYSRYVRKSDGDMYI